LTNAAPLNIVVSLIGSSKLYELGSMFSTGSESGDSGSLTSSDGAQSVGGSVHGGGFKYVAISGSVRGESGFVSGTTIAGGCVEDSPLSTLRAGMVSACTI
jgi:hypothetical protein